MQGIRITLVGLFATLFLSGVLTAQTPNSVTPVPPSELPTPAPPDARTVGSVAVGGQDLNNGAFRFLGIGIDNYQDSGMNLKTAVAGARGLHDLLVRDYTFEKENCRLLLDAAATRDGIIATLRSLAETAAPEDSVLIYYAGHGNLDSLTSKGAWVPWDASLNTPARWIGNTDVKDYLKAMKARRVLLISDSCFAGNFFRGRGVPPPPITDARVREAFGKISRMAMTAGGVEPVADGGQNGQSIYTWWLLTALRESTAPYVLPEEIHDRLKAAVSANARQKPFCGFLYGTGGEPDGTFVFFRRGTAGLDAAIQKRMDRMAELEEIDKQAVEEARRQQEEIAAKQRHLADLNNQLAELRKKLGASGGHTGLDAILAMVQEKERQAKELEMLRQKAEDELKAKEAALAEARRKHDQENALRFKDDYAKWQKISDSAVASEELKDRAWRILCTQWGLPGETRRGNELVYENGIVVNETERKAEGEKKRLTEEQHKRKVAKEAEKKGAEAEADQKRKEAAAIKTSVDGRFKVLGFGVILDTLTNLEWAVGPDSNTTYNDAERWVNNLTVAGGGWRMPLRTELRQLYQSGKGTRNMAPVFGTTGWWVWAEPESRDSSSAWNFDFNSGDEYCRIRNASITNRAFAVRSRR